MNLKSNANGFVAAGAIASALLSSSVWAHIPIPPKAPTEIGRRLINAPVPEFQLMDQDGRVFRFATARGKLVLVTFIYTTCTDVCPLLTAKFAAVQRELEKEKNKNYLLLSVTTDPEVDTPATLNDYGQRFKANFTHWSFLTGTRSNLAKVWKAFGVHVLKNQSGQVQHTTLTTLVDPSGTRRVDFYGDKWQDKEVLKDIQWLASEKNRSSSRPARSLHNQ